jgi:hypothetical protein
MSNYFGGVVCVGGTSAGGEGGSSVLIKLNELS